MTPDARGLACLLAAAAMPGALASCSAGVQSSGATVLGRVQDESGAAIPGADVSLDARQTGSAPDGTFRLAAEPGRSTLSVAAAGYRSLSFVMRIASGDNPVELTLVACTPGLDAGCEGTPTPTPTPATTPNVVASFSSTNPSVNPLAGGVVPTWTGSASLTGQAATLRLGEPGDAADVAFSECYASTDESNSIDGTEALDHCVFWWDGLDQGGLVDSGLPDALFLVRVPGTAWMAGNTLSIEGGTMTAGYYEADLLLAADSYVLKRPATKGTLVLGQAGRFGGQSVSIAGQATFYIPSLP